MVLESVQISTALKQRVYEGVLSELQRIIAAKMTKMTANILSLREVKLPDKFSEEYAFRGDLCEQNTRADNDVNEISRFLEELRLLSALSCYRVEVGALVETRDCASNVVEICLLVPAYGQTRFLEEPRVDLATPSSPVGRALIGHMAGETVTVQSPNGPRTLEIRAVV